MRKFLGTAACTLLGLAIWSCGLDLDSIGEGSSLLDGGVDAQPLADADAEPEPENEGGFDDAGIDANDANVDGSFVDASDADSGDGGIDSGGTDGGLEDSGIDSGVDSGTDSGAADSGALFSVGGNATGIGGDAVLSINGGDDLTVSADGTFTFATKLLNGQTYSVTLFSPPSGHYCKLTNATGLIAGANVSNVGLACVLAPNCQSLHAFDSSFTNGLYSIDPDGVGALPLMTVYCDMTTAGGGWTQVFDHDVSKGYRAANLWSSVNPTLPNQGLYSILNQLGALKSGANYEFRMNWTAGNPNIVGKSLQWTQVQNPTAVTDPTAVTVSNLVQNPTNQTGGGAFSGLAMKVTGNSYLSGERTGFFYWPIGVAAAFVDGTGVSGVPTFISSSAGAAGSATRSQLWIR